MIKLPELSSTHNVVTESAYDILSSNIDNLYTTLGTVTDYVSAAQQQGEIAAISAANVAVSSMETVNEHLTQVLEAEENVKDISSSLVSSVSTINQYDERLKETEDTLDRYLDYSSNVLKNFETFELSNLIIALDQSKVSARYYTDAPWQIRGINSSGTAIIPTNSEVSCYKFNEIGQTSPAAGITKYININCTNSDRVWIFQSGMPSLSSCMTLSVYARGKGTLQLYANRGFCTAKTVTNDWQRYTYVITAYNLADMKNPYGVGFQATSGSNIDFCGFQFEYGSIATLYNPISNNGVLPNNIEIYKVFSDSIETKNVLTNTISRKVNTNDNSPFPLTYIENNYVEPCCKQIGVNGSANWYYTCDQYYHYLFRDSAIYVYDDKCMFVNVLSGTPSNDYSLTLWYHDPPQCWQKIATNDNKKTMILYKNTYGNTSNMFKILIRDLNTNEVITKMPMAHGKQLNDKDYYIGYNSNLGYVSVNELTQHFIIFTSLQQVQYTYNEDGSYSTSAEVFLKNGYVCLNDDGYFTKYNFETSAWDESSDFTVEYFHEVSTTQVSSWCNSSNILRRLCFFRNTSRKRNPPANERVTWLVHTTATSADNGVWAFDEYDNLLPVYGNKNNTTGYYNNGTGIIPLDFKVSSYKITSPYSKTISYRNAPYFIHAHTQPDTVGATNTTCAKLVCGRYSYCLFKNPNTGEVSSCETYDTNCSTNGIYGTHVAEIASNIDCCDRVCIMTADGGNYGGSGQIARVSGNSFIPLNNNQLAIPIKLLNSTGIFQNTAGIRSVRMPDAYHLNLNNATAYSALWRGPFITTL